MSPGLVALGPGMFSHKGVTETRLILKYRQYKYDVELKSSQ